MNFKNRKTIWILLSLVIVTLIGFAGKRLSTIQIQCDSVFEVGNQPNDIGRLDLLTHSCKDYYVDAGWYIEDVKILYASKLDPARGTMVKQVSLYTRDDSGLVKLPEPKCFRQVWNEERLKGGQVQLACDSDPDFSRLLEILSSVSLKASEDKRHLLLEYGYQESRF